MKEELIEALSREALLKMRLQSLAGSVEAATKSSEEKYHLVQTTVAELKQTNVYVTTKLPLLDIRIMMQYFYNISTNRRSLTQSLDRCRRKYQSRLRRLELQMMELTATNQTKTTTTTPPAEETTAAASPAVPSGGTETDL